MPNFKPCASLCSSNRTKKTWSGSSMRSMARNRIWMSQLRRILERKSRRTLQCRWEWITRNKAQKRKSKEFLSMRSQAKRRSQSSSVKSSITSNIRKSNSISDWTPWRKNNNKASKLSPKINPTNFLFLRKLQTSSRSAFQPPTKGRRALRRKNKDQQNSTSLVFHSNLITPFAPTISRTPSSPKRPIGTPSERSPTLQEQAESSGNQSPNPI